MLHTDSKICGPKPDDLGDDYEGFLCAVANGEDKVPDVGIRSRFTRLYGKWFPPFEAGRDLHAHKAYYREVNDWWKTDLAKFPFEELDIQFGLHAAILRRKLRVIWLLAASDSTDEATHKIDQLSTRYYRNYYLDVEGGAPSEARRQRLMGACQWLRGNLKKLRVCKNPKCQQMTTYFLQYKNRKYCSTVCYAEAETLRRAEPAKVNPKQYKRTPRARENMTESALKRWEEHRKKLGSKRGDRAEHQKSVDDQHD